MVLVRAQEDVIHDLVEYMIPLEKTYFSIKIGDFLRTPEWIDALLYRIYYKHLLYYNEVCHYRWYLVTRDRTDNPLFLDIKDNDTVYFSNDSNSKNPHMKYVVFLLEKKRHHTLNIHPKIVEKEIELDRDLPYSFLKNPSDKAVTYILDHFNQIVDFSFFVKNTNPRAVDYCIRMWDRLSECDKYNFSCNQSQKAIDWLIQNQYFIRGEIKYNPFNYSYNRLKYVGSKRLLFGMIVNP